MRKFPYLLRASVFSGHSAVQNKHGVWNSWKVQGKVLLSTKREDLYYIQWNEEERSFQVCETHQSWEIDFKTLQCSESPDLSEDLDPCPLPGPATGRCQPQGGTGSARFSAAIKLTEHWAHVPCDLSRCGQHCVGATSESKTLSKWGRQEGREKRRLKRLVFKWPNWITFSLLTLWCCNRGEEIKAIRPY